MKLISCHIDNFGGLHNYDMVFEEGLNIVLQDNGWGKTTLAAYFKAMLYGFDTRRSKDITENERKRYLPWQGGQYGGSLDIEIDGKRYRIHRSFGETPKSDRIRIIDLAAGATARINTDNLGEELFHLDANAFQRSVFIGQNGLFIDGAASSIHTRLNALVSQANDLAMYDEAISRLTTQMKVYEKRGQRGLIDEITRQLAEKESLRDRLETDIARQDAARERISEIDNILAAIRPDIEEKKFHLEEISGEANKQEATQKILDGLNSGIAEAEKTIREIETGFGGEVPDNIQINHIKERQKEAEVYAVKAEELAVKYEKLNQDYEAVLTPYDHELPTAAQLDEIQRIYGELQGFRSSGEESDIVENAPEGYTLISTAQAISPDYPDRLHEVIATGTRLQDLLRASSELEGEIRHETENWADKKRRYGVLDAEAEKLRSEIEMKKVYAPSAIDPVLADLEGMQKRQQELTKRVGQLDGAVQHEEENWADKKQKYEALRKEAVMLESEVNEKERYRDAVVRPVLSRLEEMQKQQQLLNLRQSELSDSLTDSDKKLLTGESEKPLPDLAEGQEIISCIREAGRLSDSVRGLKSRLDGEKSKADSLKSSLEQTGTDSGIKEYAEKPKKSASGVMIGAGAALAILGIILAMVLTPAAAVLSVIGIVLAAAGIVINKSYRRKQKEYEDSLASAKRRREVLERRKELQAQLDMAESRIASLQEQILEANSDIMNLNERINTWASIWLPAGSEVCESSVSAVLDHVSRIMRLRNRQEEAARKQKRIEDMSSELRSERKQINSDYPEISSMSVPEALNFLRAAQTDYKVVKGQFDAAIRTRDSFVTESGIEADAFAAEKSPQLQELTCQKEQAAHDLSQICKERERIDEQYPEIAGKSLTEAQNILREKESDYKVIEGQFRSAVRNRDMFVSELNVTPEAFAAEESDTLSVLRTKKKEAEENIEKIIAADNEILSSIGITISKESFSDELSGAMRQLNAFNAYSEKKEERTDRQQKRADQMNALEQKLAEKSIVLKDRYKEFSMPERLAKIREDIGRAMDIGKERRENLDEQQSADACRKAAAAEVEAFVREYMRFPSETGDPVSEIVEKASVYRDQVNARNQIEKQRDEIIRNMKETGNSGILSEREEIRSEIQRLEERRDKLLMEYQEKGDAIRQADQSLQIYSDTLREIRQLYDQKQKAQSSLSILKKTIQMIQIAKENLANRYLSRVEELFNHYMRIWLDNEQIWGILDIDFSIQIEENDKVHVAQGYSTGYCDILDFCMRLALVDTLFEKEQPFLILDDPFVNLDAIRLGKAMEFLNVMAANKQVIYFVCHPVRAVQGSISSHSKEEFARLAEETRKTLAKRNSLSDVKRKSVKKSPREMYTIVNFGEEPAIRPANPDFVITNSIFSMDFVVSNPLRLKDISYELFFIDEVGHILNERQIIEIKNGKMSADRILFSLNTRDDSGERYELMIRESGQDDFEVLGRFPFSAKLAFAGTSVFDFGL